MKTMHEKHFKRVAKLLKYSAINLLLLLMYQKDASYLKHILKSSELL